MTEINRRWSHWGQGSQAKSQECSVVTHVDFEVPQHDGRLGVQRTVRQGPKLNVNVRGDLKVGV